jgi:hypothetical protein
MYEWAVNQSKLARAKIGTETEEETKEKYIKLGGKVINSETEEVKFVGDGLRIVPKKIKSDDNESDKQTEDEYPETALAVAKKKRLSRIP